MVGNNLKMVFFLISIVLLAILLVWVFGFFSANDFSVPTKKLGSVDSSLSKVLVVFPHADDEVLSMGGLLSRLARRGSLVTWMILTKGERGNDEAKLDEDLGISRTVEAEKAAQIYGVDKLIQLDFPDGQVEANKEDVAGIVERVIEEVEPNLILTYDLAGMYGHPDHMVVSDIVTRLVEDKFPSIRLWYVSFSKKVLDSISLPEYMAKDNNFKSQRVYPSFKIWSGLVGVSQKVRVVYTYRSQINSFKKGFPIRAVPLWFYITLLPYEYFHEAN